jgi:proteasome lid subunit RPN8/RPN11
MQIAADLLQQIVDHARREAPVECCGFVEVADGRAVSVIEAENIAASPLRFEVGPQDLLKLADIDERGRQAVIYHSHTRSDPVPSQTDVNFSANWPGVEWLIIGVAGDQPDVRHWRIEDGRATQVEVQVDEAAA